MTTKLERINAKIDAERKALQKACDKRDAAIITLGKAAAAIKAATRTISRLEGQRTEARREERAASKGAAARTAADGPLAPL